MKKNYSIISSKHLPRVVKNNIQVAFLGVTLVVLLLGTTVAVQLSQKQQELRQQASVVDGDILVSTSAPATITPGEPTFVTLAINTQGVPIDGVELHFHLEGAASAPTIEPLTVNRLNTVPGDVVASGTGYDLELISMAPWDATPFVGYSNTSYVEFVRVNFIASTTASQVTLTFNNGSDPTRTETDESYSNITDSDPTLDGLNVIADASFPITITQPTSTLIPTNTLEPTATLAQVTVTDEPTPTQCAQPTLPLCEADEHAECVNTTGQAVCQQCNCVENDAPTATPTQIVEITDAPTATPTIEEIGGADIQYCGESCDDHSDCAVNLMCYSKVCRLANNPTDTSCNNPPDNGIHRTCNEYCADSRECRTGLTCYYNKCRNPRNETDQYCSEPIVVVPTRRPGTRVPTSTPRPTTPPATINLVQEPTRTPFPSSTPRITSTPFPSIVPIAEVSQTPEDEGEQIEEVSIVERIQNWLKALLVIALVISGIFFLLWILPIFLKRRREDDEDDDLPPPMSSTGTTHTSQYTESLKSKTSNKDDEDEL